MHNIDTTGWSEFPFEVNGVNFISKLAPNSPFQARVKALPAGMFESMNKSAIIDLVGTTATKDELLDKLAYVNKGATHALIELA